LQVNAVQRMEIPDGGFVILVDIPQINDRAVCALGGLRI